MWGEQQKLIRIDKSSLALGFLVVILSMILSHCAPITLKIVSEKTGSFDLANIKGKTLAFLPLRGTWGGLTTNKTIRERLIKRLVQLYPDIKILQIVQLQRLLASKGNKTGLQYAAFMQNKYIPRALFSQEDLAVFRSNDIDYLACISLNGDITGGPRRYIFVVSMQIWDVARSKIVWDLTFNGQIIILKSDDDHQAKLVIMGEMADFVLAKLSP
jgi:hypothetical protein